MRPRLESNHDGAQSAAKKEAPFRCLCGSLLARLVPQGVELKCRRCKRHVILPLQENLWAKISMRT